MLHQRSEARLETETPEDRHYILDALGANVLIQADGVWELELQVPREVPKDNGDL